MIELYRDIFHLQIGNQIFQSLNATGEKMEIRHGSNYKIKNKNTVQVITIFLLTNSNKLL
jgi:hypothetical protein